MHAIHHHHDHVTARRVDDAELVHLAELQSIRRARRRQRLRARFGLEG